jgi:lauroyl/myristoyl acyltransferase
MQAVLGFPRWTQEQWNTLWKEYAEQTTLMLIELVQLFSMPVDEVHRRITLEGEEHIHAALQSKRNVMIFVNHLGNMASTVGELANRGFDVTLSGNEIWIPFLERKLQQIHQKVGAHRVHIGNRLPMAVSGVFDRHGLFATFIDFSPLRKHTTWVKFGCTEMSVSIAPALLAIRHSATILCATSTRMPGNKHHVVISPLQTADSSGDIRSDAEKLTQLALHHVETALFEHPEQWWPWDKAHIRLEKSFGESHSTQIFDKRIT